MTELDKSGEGQAAQTAIQPVNPLRLLPKEYRKAASFFVMAHSDTLKNGVAAFCARIAMWIKNYSLTLDDIREIFHRASEPGECEKYLFGPAEFEAKFAGHVRQHLQRREAAAEAERLRTERDQFESDMKDPEFRKRREDAFAMLKALTENTHLPPREL